MGSDHLDGRLADRGQRGLRCWSFADDRSDQLRLRTRAAPATAFPRIVTIASTSVLRRNLVDLVVLPDSAVQLDAGFFTGLGGLH
jgi:hypothetical protein